MADGLICRTAAATGKWSGLRIDFALSCLVDADHSDTARNYEKQLRSSRQNAAGLKDASGA